MAFDDKRRRSYKGTPYAITSELGGAGDHIIPLDEDDHAESAAITSYPDGISIMPVTAAADWGDTSVEGTYDGQVLTMRTGTTGFQLVSFGEGGFEMHRWWDTTGATWFGWGYWRHSTEAAPALEDRSLEGFDPAESLDLSNYMPGLTVTTIEAAENFGPNTGQAGFVITYHMNPLGTIYGQQVFVVPSAGTSYVRYYTGGAWGSWSEVGGGGGASDHITRLATDSRLMTDAPSAFPDGLSVMDSVDDTVEEDTFAYEQGGKVTIRTTRNAAEGICIQEELFYEWQDAIAVRYWGGSSWSSLTWMSVQGHTHDFLGLWGEDSGTESSAITAFPAGFSMMPVTAAQNWGITNGRAGHVITERNGSVGRQTFVAHASGASEVRYYTGGAWGSWSVVGSGGTPAAHAASHVNGTDDIQNATASQKGLATAAQITKLDGIEAGATGDQTATEIRSLLAGGLLSPSQLELPEQGSPSSPAADNGRLYTLDVGGKTEPEYRDSGGVVGRPFLDTYFVAQNTTGSTINKGTVVRISGQSASRIPLIAVADADGSSTMPAAGIAMENISNNGYGRVMVQGVLTALATTGLTAGAPVYVSGTAGAITATAPVYPAYRQVLGSVMSVHGSTGEIFVNVAHFFRQVGTPIPIVLFDGGSTLATSALADVGAWVATTNMAGTLTEVRGRLRTASSSGSVTAVVTLNGTTTIGTLTFTASSLTSNTLTPAQAIAAGDWITVHVTAAGTGAKMLTVAGELMTAA